MARIHWNKSDNRYYSHVGVVVYDSKARNFYVYPYKTYLKDTSIPGKHSIGPFVNDWEAKGFLDDLDQRVADFMVELAKSEHFEVSGGGKYE